MHKTKRFLLAGCALLAFGLSACGKSAGTASSGSSSTTLTGSVTAAPTNGASVRIKDTSGNTLAGPVTTGSDGTFSIDIANSNLTGNLVFESTGGTFTDESTSTAGVAGGTMTAYVSASGLSSVHISPPTTVIQKLVAGGKTLAQAQSDFNTAFGFTPDETVRPADAVTPSGSATDAEKLMGLRIAAFSQLTADLGLQPNKQFELINALAQDLTDGALDGVDGNGAVQTLSGHPLDAGVKNRFTRAVMNFRNGNDGTGLTPDKIGAPPFGLVDLTGSYKVTYIPGMMSASQGKTTFKIRVQDNGGNPVTGLTPALTPKMHMSAMTHATPVYKVTDNNDGTYTCIVFYLMASSMSGTSMGFWELKVDLGGGQIAMFYPPVGMAMPMGDTARATLKNSGDTLTVMGNSQSRTYYVFKDSVTGSTGNHTFKIFISADGDGMRMSFPSVTQGATLGGSNSLTVNTIAVQASADGTTWVNMTDNADGTFTSGALVTTGNTTALYVKMTINSTQYTTNGNAVDGTNDYATFTVTLP